MKSPVVVLHSYSTASSILVTFEREDGNRRSYLYDGHFKGLISMASVVRVSRLSLGLDIDGRIVTVRDDRTLTDRHSIYFIRRRYIG